MSKQPYLQLVGGECDGHTIPISHADSPDVFYAVPLLDVERIKNTRGNKAKVELHHELAVLAYKFQRVEAKDDGLQFLYYRCPEKDKTRKA